MRIALGAHQPHHPSRTSSTVRVRSRIPPPSVMRYPPAGRDRRANAEELPPSPDMGRRPRL